MTSTSAQAGEDMAIATPPRNKERTGFHVGVTLSYTLSVPPESAGLRLDVLLKKSLPGLGLRASRRLWDWYSITVNERRQKAGYIVSSGDNILLALNKDICQNMPERPPAVCLLALNRDYAAFGKPEGLHSAQIAGSRCPSLEGMLCTAWPELWRQWMASRSESIMHMPDSPPPTPQLLTRLDKATSGLLLGAITPAAKSSFRLYEQQGLVKKTYFAIVRGELEQTLYLAWRLNTAKRARTLVIEEDDPDPARHTSVVPVSIVNTCSIMGSGASTKSVPSRSTLARVLIKRGARHQIRAHLAKAGFPLLGEWLYAPYPDTSDRLFLHHARVEFPGFTAQQQPGWFEEPGFNFLCETGCNHPALF